MKTATVADVTETIDHRNDFKEAVDCLKNEYPDKAIPRLRRALQNDEHNPYYLSFLGLALARAEKSWDEAADLCEKAIQLKRKEIQFHMNLMEVCAMAGRREQALNVLEKASRIFHNDSRLKRARSKLQQRRDPVLPFFDRGHFLNRELGKMRHGIIKRLKK